MNPTPITGHTPDFLTKRKLVEVAQELFRGGEWTQPTSLDEDMHQMISEMVRVGLLDWAIALRGGVQIVVYKLSEAE